MQTCWLTQCDLANITEAFSWTVMKGRCVPLSVMCFCPSLSCTSLSCSSEKSNLSVSHRKVSQSERRIDDLMPVSRGALPHTKACFLSVQICGSHGALCKTFRPLGDTRGIAHLLFWTFVLHTLTTSANQSPQCYCKYPQCA